MKAVVVERCAVLERVLGGRDNCGVVLSEGCIHQRELPDPLEAHHVGLRSLPGLEVGQVRFGSDAFCVFFQFLVLVLAPFLIVASHIS